MQRFLDGFARVLSSLGLSCVLLILLALLTWLGTLEQTQTGLFEVQRKYFESIWLVHHAGPVPIPLPGATLVMGVLFVNLILGGLVRMRKGAATIGVLITHVGILMLVVAGFVKQHYSEDGHLTLYEGESANTFQSYHRWEVAVLEPLDSGQVRETVAPEETFVHATTANPVRLHAAQLPFELELRYFQPNSNVFPKGPMVQAALPVIDGYVLNAQPKEPENERNMAGAYATVVDSKGTRREAILWGAAREPWTVEVDGRRFGIELRREQYVMPFTIEMDDFVKEDHPRINMPKAFSSDVTVLEGDSTRQVKIQMNEPLRSEGLVLYQSSWGPSNARPGDRLFSTLAVVRNPADQYPLYACIVIAIGMVTHFSRKLAKHIRSEAKKS